MQTVHEAAIALRDASDEAGLQRIASALGFGNLEELDAHTASSLGVDETGARPLLAPGAGALRMLVCRAADGRAVRDTLVTLASRLASRTPQILWCVLVTGRRDGALAIGCWSVERHPPRVAALVTDREAITDSDAETLLALAECSGSADVIVHARWMETLGRSAVGRRFYRELEQRVSTLAESAEGRAPAELRREVALCYTSRLLFLAFLQAKRWLDGDRQFLSRTFEECMADGGRYDRRVLRPLFFGTLNTRLSARSERARSFGRVPFLNGGLFSRTPAERKARLIFTDAALGELHTRLLSRFRFTVRENAATWSEAAVDPEILGRAFESLMHQGERRQTGTFYTPQPLVDQLGRAALDELLRNREPLEVTVLDPACGSGAFLVHALERLAAVAAERGDARRQEAIRREVLRRCIFGVDLNPTAVWLCELRLWLSVVIDAEVSDLARIPPLPNLDRNIRVGDALLGDEMAPPGGGGSIAGKLRERYSRATGRRKESLARALDRAERARAVAAVEREMTIVAAARRERAIAARGAELFDSRAHRASATDPLRVTLRDRARRLRRERARLVSGGAVRFSFAAHFGGVAERGGFDMVIGNPPWVRLHNIAPELRAILRERYSVFRAPAWCNGELAANGGQQFAAQPDLAAAFIERGVRLLRPGGTLALLLPAKLWKSLAGAGVRALLGDTMEMRCVEDWSEAPSAFDAAAYPSLIVATRRDAGDAAIRREEWKAGGDWNAPDIVEPARGALAAGAYKGGRRLGWSGPAAALPLDASRGSPWLIVPPPVRKAFDHLRDIGTPLGATAFGRPVLGVKSGLNEAFVVSLRSTAGSGGSVRIVGSDGSDADVEAAMLRPLLRGEDVRAWRRPPASEYLVWTHGGDGRPLPVLPPRAERWLRRWRGPLAARSDRRSSHPWWTLYRTEGAAPGPRVVWCDMGRRPRAVVVGADDPVIPLNSCYVIRCTTMEDAWALAALFNSLLPAAWLDVIAEPARGGYRRFLAWTTSILPVPADWGRTRAILSPYGKRACDGQAVSESELLDAVLRAFGARRARLLPLLEWCAS